MKYLVISLLWITCLCGSIFNRVHIRRSLKSSQDETKKSTLNEGERLYSKNEKYYVAMQADGNFVLYDRPNKKDGKSTPIWNSKTNGKEKGPYKATMQDDGNLVVYAKNNKPIWDSRTNGQGKGPYKVTVQDDGNFVLYDATNKPYWASRDDKTRRRFK